MKSQTNRVCPVERAGGLDTSFRRLTQNPRRILKRYIREGMTVLDLGCGPGFFTLPMAEMVGPSGHVIAADLQEGMLDIVRNKVHETPYENRIICHLCQSDHTGITEKIDFILAFYLVHEVPDQEELFNEFTGLLKPDGLVLVVEPPFHVSRADFRETLQKAQNAGLEMIQRPFILLSRSMLLAHAPLN